MLKIVSVPNKILNSPTKPVTKFDGPLKKLVIDMEETLIAQVDPQGVGLAATQIGQSLSLFIMRPDPDSDTKVFINPKILSFAQKVPNEVTAKRKRKKNTPLEGCLSIPRIWSPVKRAYKVLVEYQDNGGKVFQNWFEDFEAVIVQHEVDHLNGILFTQRALEQNTQLFEEKDGELEKIDSNL